MSLLVATSLVVGRGGFRLQPFHLRLEAGQTLAVLGPNGAGKSTLLKTLAGLLPPLSGELTLDGRQPSALSPAARAVLAAYAPPPGEVSAPFDAIDMVRMGRIALGGGSEADALVTLRRFGVAPLARRRFDRLSTGERQLVLLARTLFQGARLCLFDEPTGALDPGRTLAVAEALRTLAAEGRAVAYATHDLRLAASADAALWITPDGAVEAMAPLAATAPAFAARYGAPGTWPDRRQMDGFSG